MGPFHRGDNAWAAKEPASPLVEIPGFSIWRWQFDLMHTLDLGILQRVIPAALQGLMGLPAGTGRVADEPPMWAGRSRAARCKAATLDYLEWAGTAVASSARVKKITPRWVQGQYPDISQEHAKAAALRAMLPWVVDKAQKRSGASEAATLRARCLSSLAAMDAVYSRQPRFLSAGQEREAQAFCTEALEALAALVQLQPAGPWRMQPKAHALWHITQHSCMGNPRVSHCYQDEDFIGKVKRLYTACHGRTAPLRTIQRYCMGTSLRLKARQELMDGLRRPKARLLRGGPQRSAPVRADAAGASSSSRPAPSAAAASEASFGSKRGRGRPARQTVKRDRGRPRKPTLEG